MNASRTAKGFMLAALVGVATAVGLAWTLSGSQREASATVIYEESDRPGSATLSANDAVAQAEEKVGYDVRAPDDVPAGFTLRSVRAEVGPVGPDQNGVVRDLSHIRTVSLLYKDDADRMLVLEQHAPERSIGAFAGSRPVDAAEPDVTATILQRPGVTHLIWDSPTATYRTTLTSPDDTIDTGAEATLLSVIRSMR